MKHADLLLTCILKARILGCMIHRVDALECVCLIAKASNKSPKGVHVNAVSVECMECIQYTTLALFTNVCQQGSDEFVCNTHLSRSLENQHNQVWQVGLVW